MNAFEESIMRLIQDENKPPPVIKKKKKILKMDDDRLRILKSMR